MQSREANIVLAGAMASNVTSAWVPTAGAMQYLIHLSYTGTPTGTFTVEGSNDPEIVEQKARRDGLTGLEVTPASTAKKFVYTVPSALVHGDDLTPAGAAGETGIVIDFPARFIRLVYTASSGSGVLNAWGHGV